MSPMLALAEDRTSSYDEHIKFVSLEVNAGSVEKAEAKLKITLFDKFNSLPKIYTRYGLNLLPPVLIEYRIA